jgi:hypothetical protein
MVVNGETLSEMRLLWRSLGWAALRAFPKNTSAAL